MAKLLDQIHVPADVRRLSRLELKQLATELREFVVQTVAQTGGHFSSNLGTVELTIALHYVFDTPHDRLVWDVGHQTYPHKTITGARTGWRRCASSAASRASRAATKASTTPSAPLTRRPRSRPRSAWRSRRG
jgi:deoxyxylulose-5-phosphate synthase